MFMLAPAACVAARSPALCNNLILPETSSPFGELFSFRENNSASRAIFRCTLCLPLRSSRGRCRLGDALTGCISPPLCKGRWVGGAEPEGLSAMVCSALSVRETLWFPPHPPVGIPAVCVPVGAQKRNEKTIPQSPDGDSSLYAREPWRSPLHCTNGAHFASLV